MGKQVNNRYFTYVLRCKDNTLYTGFTNDVDKRVACHNAGTGAKYTKSRRPVTLIAQAQFDSKHEALSAEYRFKQLSRTKKEELLQQCATTPFDQILRTLFDDSSSNKD